MNRHHRHRRVAHSANPAAGQPHLKVNVRPEEEIIHDLDSDVGRPLTGAEQERTALAHKVAGKPSAAFFSAATRSLGLAAGPEVAMVGDDLWSDVEGAQRAGLQGWLVRTGKFREDVLRAASITPDRILSSVADLS